MQEILPPRTIPRFREDGLRVVVVTNLRGAVIVTAGVIRMRRGIIMIVIRRAERVVAAAVTALDVVVRRHTGIEG